MERILKKIKQKNIVVSVYNESDTGNCWTGFVCDVDEEFLLLGHISENGFYGGFTLISLDTIRNVEEGTSYEKKVHKLYELRKQSHPKIKLCQRDNLMDSLLEYVYEEKYFLSITLNEGDEYPLTGVLTEVLDDEVTVQIYSSYGIKNGFSHLKKDAIYQIFVDGLPEQNVSLISQNPLD